MSQNSYKKYGILGGDILSQPQSKPQVTLEDIADIKVIHDLFDDNQGKKTSDEEFRKKVESLCRNPEDLKYLKQLSDETIYVVHRLKDLKNNPPTFEVTQDDLDDLGVLYTLFVDYQESGQRKFQDAVEAYCKDSVDLQYLKDLDLQIIQTLIALD